MSKSHFALRESPQLYTTFILFIKKQKMKDKMLKKPEKVCWKGQKYYYNSK